MELLLVWLLVALSLAIVSKLGLGIQIDSFGTALIAAIVIGLVNALIRPILVFLTFPLTILTLGLFLLVVNGFCLAIASKFVSGFRVNGLLGAIIGSISLSVINLIIAKVTGVPI